MKRSKLKTDLKLKDGRIFAKGTYFGIRVEFAKPMMAILVDDAGEVVKLWSRNLWKYFEDFIDPIDESDTGDSSIGTSLTGKHVEPDGWDEHGMPSSLLSLGMI